MKVDSRALKVRLGIGRWLCRAVGHHWELVWGDWMDREQWYLLCVWCSDRRCVPARRHHPHFGGPTRRRRVRGRLLIRLEMRHLCAGVIAAEGKVIRAAPVLAWSVGRTPQEVCRWCTARGGEWAVIDRWTKESSDDRG